NAVPPFGNELGRRWGSEGASTLAGASPLVPPPSQSAAIGTHVDLDLLGVILGIVQVIGAIVEWLGFRASSKEVGLELPLFTFELLDFLLECGDAFQGIAMATLPISDLLAEYEVLALQALDFGAQLEHFPVRALDWVNQLRGGAPRTTDLYQLVDHDQPGLPRRPRFGKRRVPFLSTTNRPVRTGLAKLYHFFDISSNLTTINTRAIGSVMTLHRHFHVSPLDTLARKREGSAEGATCSVAQSKRGWSISPKWFLAGATLGGGAVLP